MTSAEYKKKRKEFLKGSKSKDAPTFEFIIPSPSDFEEGEYERKMRRTLELAAKGGHLADPRVLECPLDSLFFLSIKGSNDWKLDSVEIIDCQYKPDSRICPFCERCFTPKTKRQKYCSKRCGGRATGMHVSKKARESEAEKAKEIIIEELDMEIEQERGSKEEIKLLKAKKRSLKNSILARQRKEEQEAKKKGPQHCRVCDTILTSLNWYESSRRKGARICKLCALRQSAEYYRRKTEERKNAEVRVQAT